VAREASALSSLSVYQCGLISLYSRHVKTSSSNGAGNKVCCHITQSIHGAGPTELRLYVEGALYTLMYTNEENIFQKVAGVENERTR
jgi:hypothetical protein